jgi:redox-sensitive bicupin YhaK (pirin superfamily)
VQLWVAQPDATRRGAPAFEHHAESPRVEIDRAVATVLVGELGGAVSSARRDTDHAGVDLDVRPGPTTLPLRPDYEHALVVLRGALHLGDRAVTPGHLAYLGLHRDELTLTAEEPTRALLIGGVPLGEPVLMWWNFVARSRAEIVAAHADWSGRAGRFGEVVSPLPRIEVERPPWKDG